jgi:hypothetical protein
MPCGANENDYCDFCTCEEKLCYRCNQSRHLADFNRTKVPHVLRMKDNKGRRFACIYCEEKMDKKYIKLYEVPPRTVVDFKGRKIYFNKVDGMYSVCYEEDGTLIHLNCGVWVEILPDCDYNDIEQIIKEKEIG